MKEEVRKMFLWWNSNEVLNFSSNQSFVYEKEDNDETWKDYWAYVTHHKHISIEKANQLEQ